MLARRIMGKRRFVERDDWSGRYLADTGFVVEPILQSGGRYAYEYYFPYGTTGSLEQFSPNPNVRGFMSADRTVIAMRRGHSSGSQHRVLEWLTPNFDIETPLRDVELTIASPRSAQVQRDVVLQLYPSAASGTPTGYHAVTSTRWDGTPLGSINIPDSFQPNWRSPSGRAVFFRGVGARAEGVELSASLSSPYVVGAVQNAVTDTSRKTNNSLQIRTPYTANINTPAFARLDQALNLSYVDVPTDAALFPPIPSGAELMQVYATNHVFVPHEGWIQARDAIYFVASSTVNRLWKGADLGVIPFRKSSGLGSADSIEAAFASRTVIGLWRMTDDGSMTLLNILRCVTNQWSGSPMCIEPATGWDQATWRTLWIARQESNYAPVITQDYVLGSDIDRYSLANSVTGAGELWKVGNYVYLNNGSKKVEIGVDGVTTGISIPSTGAFQGLHFFEKQGLVFFLAGNSTSPTFYQSVDGGQTWTQSLSSLRPPSPMWGRRMTPI